MASNSILKLQVDDKQYEASLKSAQQGLKALQDALRNSGKSFADVDKATEQYIRELGKMGTTAKTARGSIGEMSSTFVELSRIEKHLTDQERQSPVGKALSESLAQLKQRTIDAKNELQGLENQLKNVADVKLPETGGLFGGGKLDGMLQVFGGNLMTKGAGMLAGLASEMGDMVQQGIELAKQGEGIRIAFERLGRGDILDGLRQATHGTVTDLELMKAAVKFNDFKLPVEELGTMLAFAQQKAKDTGQSVDYMVDSIVTGLGRKSLMILDNLGLSASEIKEKMAETGDMTKAVGEIIREQMSKAGDYVETAADRAAQANVNLQNKMEELGRKFAPLQEASNNLWTSMKIGIMDLIGGPLTNFINKLTEAGRIAQQYGVLGGNAKVGRMTQNLSNAREGNRQSIYNQQVSSFWRYINPREQQLKDIRAWQSGQRGEALQGRISAITEKYGSLDATKIQAEVDAAKKMLADYQQAAKNILNPVKAEIDTSEAELNVTSLKKKLAELEAQRKKAIAAGDTDLSKSLLKQINQTKADIRGLDPNALKTTTTNKNKPEYLDFYKQQLNADKGGGLKSEFEHISPMEKFKDQAKFDPENILGSPENWEKAKDVIAGTIGGVSDILSGSLSEVEGFKESLDNLSFEGFQESYEKVEKDVKGLTKNLKQQNMAMSLAASAANSFGAALSGIDDPAARAAGTVISAIANIALGFGMAVAQAGKMGPWAWLAYVAAGTAALATTISTVHSLTGYANGGMIEGNSYSGDNLMSQGPDGGLIGLNAGEIVLSKSMQNNLANTLSSNGSPIRVIGRVRGSDIVLSVDRSLKSSGRGELLTWG